MDELIFRSLLGKATPEEEERLGAWRASVPVNERRYEELSELWYLTGAAAPLKDEVPPSVNALIARAEMGTTVQAASGTPGVAPIRFARSKRTRIGRSRRVSARQAVACAIAAGLVAVSFGIGVGKLRTEREARPWLLSEGEIVTGAGELTTVSLADGSSIRLGPESHLRLADREDQRTAWLIGRAFFGVQTDSTRPFVVQTDRGDVKVFGTRFEVRTEADEFRVLVVDGNVSVTVGGAELQLSEGEMSRSVNGARPSVERVNDVYQYLDWIGNALVFQGTPLARAVREIERRYGVDISVENRALADLTVTATFTGRSVDQVISVLCEIVNAVCSVDGDHIQIGADELGSTVRTSVP